MTDDPATPPNVAPQQEVSERPTLTIDDALQKIRTRAGPNHAELGRQFEQLAIFFLRHDAQWRDTFSQVETWGQWRRKQGQSEQDTGIDIVAIDKDGDHWAIQAKCFQEDKTINKRDVDTFLSESGKAPFVKRLIISTTTRWGDHAYRAIKDQSKPCTLIGINDLRDSNVDYGAFISGKTPRQAKKALRDHQQEAVKAVVAGLRAADRGKLIMACGAGKTLTAQKIAEQVAGKSGYVLYLVPSIALLSQSLREWSNNSHDMPLRNLVVCSDHKVGREDEDLSRQDLPHPATTNEATLVSALTTLYEAGNERLTVVFATYQSIAVVARAQQAKGVPAFDLAICDEAHRTTGVEQAMSTSTTTLFNDSDTTILKGKSPFNAIHDAQIIRANKRLYMTATPRLYSDKAKSKAQSLEVYSMDDPATYGNTLYELSFSTAISQQLLTDYKVLILAINKKAAAQLQVGDLQADDTAKLIGLYNTLAGRAIGSDTLPRMQRAVAFANRIKDSQQVEKHFKDVAPRLPARNDNFTCEVQHVDGTQNAQVRSGKLQWLKKGGAANRCHLLTNARCLSEGVDVPALDAVIFLQPRRSLIDVAQSVGRVMRKVPGKTYGYIILPIVVDEDEDADHAVENNKTYDVVWEVLQALRAHDDRFRAMVNQLEINQQAPGRVRVIGATGGESRDSLAAQLSLALPAEKIAHLEGAILARMVKKMRRSALLGRLGERRRHARHEANGSDNAINTYQRHRPRPF